MLTKTRGVSRSYSPLVLTLSLALNLFLVGWGLAQNLGNATAPKIDQAPEAIAEAIASGLPKADGEKLRIAVDAKRQMLQEARHNYLVARDHLRETLLTEPLDEAVLREAMGQVRLSRQNERVLFGDIIIDVLPHMSPEGHKAFVATRMGGKS